MNSRIKKLSAALKKNSAFYASSPADIFYLSGFSGTFGRVIAFPGKSCFITDPRYKGEVKKLKLEKNFEIIITKDLKKDAKKLLSKSKNLLLPPSTGLQDYLFFKSIMPVELSGAVTGMRMIKDPSEIQLIKKAVAINEAGIRHLVSILKPGLSELDLALEFDYYTRKKGADSLSFDPIIAFNANSAVPHHKTSGTKLKKNTFILVDAGVRYGGYCSDLTRCICFGIMQTRYKDIQKHYNIVNSAKEAGYRAYKNGSFIRLADIKARNSLGKNSGFERLFTHSLGHGIGIEVHEPPAVNKKADARFKPGMVLSCEPGIYMEGKYGIRIEDDYLVTEKGPEKLGRLSDGLIIAG